MRANLWRGIKQTLAKMSTLKHTAKSKTRNTEIVKNEHFNCLEPVSRRILHEVKICGSYGSSLRMPKAEYPEDTLGLIVL